MFWKNDTSSPDGANGQPAGDDWAPGFGAPVDSPKDKSLAAPKDQPAEPMIRFIQPDAPLHPHAFRPSAELIAASPTVYLSVDAFKRMLLFVELAGKEVGWLGTVEQVEGGDFLIDKVFLLEQEVTATETELSVDGQNKLMMQLLEQGDQGLEQANRLRFWGHSHVRMGTWPSFTDERTMERFGREGLPWYIRGIFNKLGRADFCIHYYDKGYRIKDVPWAVLDAEGGRILDGTKFNVHAAPVALKSVAPPAGASQEQAAPAPQAAAAGTPPVVLENKSDTRYRGLPEVLRPDERLRQEVQAEFAAKVTERAPVVLSWLETIFGKSEDAPAAPGATERGATESGAGQSTLSERRPEEPAGDSPPVQEAPPVNRTQNLPVAPTRNASPCDKKKPKPVEREKSFLEWLFGL